MIDIAKSVLGGAWSLLVGWVLPTALNLSVFYFFIFPSLRQTPTVRHLAPTVTVSGTVVLLSGAVLIGVMLNALHKQLSRFLEGYLWPGWAYRHGCDRQRKAKERLRRRVRSSELVSSERDGKLSSDEAATLAALRADRRTARQLARDANRTAPQRAMLYEKLGRYPVRDKQIAASRFGNAVRRAEEYGFDRYELDSVDLWTALTGTAPAQVRAQVDADQTKIDFFIALLTGHAVLLAVAAAALFPRHADRPALVGTVIVLVVLTLAWYRCAIAATDDWAASVRALVETGRQPLAAALGLRLPPDLAGERRMWALLNDAIRNPYQDTGDPPGLDRYRMSPEAPGQPHSQDGHSPNGGKRHDVSAQGIAADSGRPAAGGTFPAAAGRDHGT